MRVQTKVRIDSLLQEFADYSIEDASMINAVVMDSREVKPGCCFIACKGEIVNGELFISDAISSGAIAVVIEGEKQLDAQWIREKFKSVPVFAIHQLKEKAGKIIAKFYQYPSRKTKLVGVTGTNGKTSCTHLLAQIIHAEEARCGVIGTLGAGLWPDLKTTQNTTPSPVAIQQCLDQLVGQNVKTVCMEVSSHALEQHRIQGCDFFTAVFTNLSRDHLDYHGNMQNYANAKIQLFKQENLRNVVLNLDDPVSEEIVKVLSGDITVYGITLGKSKQFPNQFEIIRAEDVVLSENGMRITLSGSCGDVEFESALVGEFNVYNLLIVFAIAMSINLPVEKIVKHIENVTAPPGRLESYRNNKLPLVVVDYAHTPAALEKSLKALQAHAKGELYVLFGCGGDRDKGKRPLMGEIAEQIADVVWLTDDNPRSEAPQQIIREILAGFKKPENVQIEHDRETAIRSIIKVAKKMDIILVAGKGHEDYQVIGEQRISFSDRDLVCTIMQEAA